MSNAFLSDKLARELRLTQMYQVMLQKMKRSVAGLKPSIGTVFVVY